MLKQNPKLSAGIKSYKILLGRFPEFQTFSNLDRVSFGICLSFFQKQLYYEIDIPKFIKSYRKRPVMKTILVKLQARPDD